MNVSNAAQTPIRFTSCLMREIIGDITKAQLERVALFCVSPVTILTAAKNRWMRRFKKGDVSGPQVAIQY
jgi:hypothetical protein